MVKKRSPADMIGDLRVRAEKFLAAGGTGLQPILPDDVRELVHELQVHQIELETQNEELRRAQETITESRNRYVDLYDKAPTGYVTLDPEGFIVDLNRKGARLLGAPRSSLIQRPFILFVAPKDRQTFHAYLSPIVSRRRQPVVRTGARSSTSARRRVIPGESGDGRGRGQSYAVSHGPHRYHPAPQGRG